MKYGIVINTNLVRESYANYKDHFCLPLQLARHLQDLSWLFILRCGYTHPEKNRAKGRFELRSNTSSLNILRLDKKYLVDIREKN